MGGGLRQVVCCPIASSSAEDTASLLKCTEELRLAQTEQEKIEIEAKMKSLQHRQDHRSKSQLWFYVDYTNSCSNSKAAKQISTTIKRHEDMSEFQRSKGVQDKSEKSKSDNQRWLLDPKVCVWRGVVELPDICESLSSRYECVYCPVTRLTRLQLCRFNWEYLQ